MRKLIFEARVIADASPDTAIFHFDGSRQSLLEGVDNRHLRKVVENAVLPFNDFVIVKRRGKQIGRLAIYAIPFVGDNGPQSTLTNEELAEQFCLTREPIYFAQFYGRHFATLNNSFLESYPDRRTADEWLHNAFMTVAEHPENFYNATPFSSILGRVIVTAFMGYSKAAKAAA